MDERGFGLDLNDPAASQRLEKSTRCENVGWPKQIDTSCSLFGHVNKLHSEVIPNWWAKIIRIMTVRLKIIYKVTLFT